MFILYHTDVLIRVRVGVQFVLTSCPDYTGILLWYKHFQCDCGKPHSFEDSVELICSIQKNCVMIVSGANVFSCLQNFSALMRN